MQPDNGTIKKAKLSIGQIIYHNFLHYRGVVYDVDFHFYGSDEWYRKIVHNQADKKQPWYHILIDNTSRRMYVPENEIIASQVKTAINHPLLEQYFTRLHKGGYLCKFSKN